MKIRTLNALFPLFLLLLYWQSWGVKENQRMPDIDLNEKTLIRSRCV